MILLPPTVRAFLCTRPVDMRKGFDGLSGLVQSCFAQDLLSGHLFLFVNRRGDQPADPLGLRRRLEAEPDAPGQLDLDSSLSLRRGRAVDAERDEQRRVLRRPGLTGEPSPPVVERGRRDAFPLAELGDRQAADAVPLEAATPEPLELRISRS